MHSCYYESLGLKIILALVLKYTKELAMESPAHLLIFIEDFHTWLVVFSPPQSPTNILEDSMKATHLISLISTVLWIPERTETKLGNRVKVLCQARPICTRGLFNSKVSMALILTTDKCNALKIRCHRMKKIELQMAESGKRVLHTYFNLALNYNDKGRKRVKFPNSLIQL